MITKSNAPGIRVLIITLCSIVIFFNFSTLQAQSKDASVHKTTSDMTWWENARFGMFIHWGLYSEAAGKWDGNPVKGAGEWIMTDFHIPREQYEQLAPKFDPVDFNASQWVAIAKKAGMKYRDHHQAS